MNVNFKELGQHRPFAHAAICLIDATIITSCRDSVVFLLLNLCHKEAHNSKVKIDEHSTTATGKGMVVGRVSTTFRFKHPHYPTD